MLRMVPLPMALPWGGRLEPRPHPDPERPRPVGDDVDPEVALAALLVAGELGPFVPDILDEDLAGELAPFHADGEVRHRVGTEPSEHRRRPDPQVRGRAALVGEHGLDVAPAAAE